MQMHERELHDPLARLAGPADRPQGRSALLAPRLDPLILPSAVLLVPRARLDPPPHVGREVGPIPVRMPRVAHGTPPRREGGSTRRSTLARPLGESAGPSTCGPDAPGTRARRTSTPASCSRP